MKQASWCLPFMLLVCAAPALGQSAAEPKNPPIPVTKLKLHPAKAPIPALKYRLMPEARDLKPGNAVTKYYRAFSPEWQFYRKDKEFPKSQDKWYEDDTKPPPEWFKFVLNFGALHEIDQGARRTYCDWEMLDALRKDGIGLLLPDIQAFREYIYLLKARARFEMLDKKFDKAVYTLQTGFSFGRHVSEGPTLIQALVGTAMTTIMLGEVEQFMQQPGAPNLYWALTDLPNPIIDLKKSLQGEKILIDSLFPGWREMVNDLKAKPFSLAEIDTLAERFHLLWHLSTSDPKGIELWNIKLGLATLTAATYPEARKFLIDQGRPKELVDKMPVTQAALLYEIYNYDRFFDDMVKWYGLPYPQMRKGTDQSEKQLKMAKAKGAIGSILATLLLPAVQKVFYAGYRTDRKVALVRCAEAIRLHAASNAGKLPASLKDITEVPVPNDPWTEKMFEYRVDGNVGTLTAGPPPGESYLPGSSWVYQITMQP